MIIVLDGSYYKHKLLTDPNTKLFFLVLKQTLDA